MPTIKINIAALVGDLCITSEDGEKVHSQIVHALQNGTDVEVDFSNVSVFASPFLNAAIGSLLRDYASEDLNRRTSFLGLTAENYALLRRVIANAREYFSNPRVRKLVDATLANSNE